MGHTPRRNPGKKIVQGERTLHAEDFLYRGANKHVVEQQGPLRVDHLAIHLPYLHIRGGEILEQRLPTTLAPGKLGIQAFRRADLVTSCHTRSRKREHVPAYSLQVMTLANSRRTPLRATVSQNIHHYDYLFLRLYQDLHSSLTTIQSPTKSTIFTPDKQHFISLKMAFLKITIA